MGAWLIVPSQPKLRILSIFSVTLFISFVIITDIPTYKFHLTKFHLLSKFQAYLSEIKETHTRPYNISRYSRKYNLIDETVDFRHQPYFFTSYHNEKCTLDYMNNNKLQQDHPCVIKTIQKYYLNKPPSSNKSLTLDSADELDRSAGQTAVVIKLLNNQTNGFFVECGALDGEYLSNTIDLERKYNWSGVLVEANPEEFDLLLSRNRKAWTLPICLSLEPFPTEVRFQPKNNTGLSHIRGYAKTLQKPGLPGIDPDLITIQCFPLYSVLLAVGQTAVDFFSLDVEGHELMVLKTIPWHRVDIKTLTVEWDNIPEGKEVLSAFMQENGYNKVGEFDFVWTRDIIFMKTSSKRQ